MTHYNFLQRDNDFPFFHWHDRGLKECKNPGFDVFVRNDFVLSTFLHTAMQDVSVGL